MAGAGTGAAVLANTDNQQPAGQESLTYPVAMHSQMHNNLLNNFPSTFGTPPNYARKVG